MRGADETVRLELWVEHRTKKAALMGLSEDDDFNWVALSQISSNTDDLEPGNVATVALPEWIAKRNGWL